ncbi:hypothetical protein [Streptomyces mirabilis]|uniref:hypothetical protein n=1 Tax=Streptomyces mirabilis TaxID=68239 RepID=UPI002251248C|nr:hypothetical protein [Streptomyces mirabilis]MCX4609508.1 hypothetical protein [Streptomyces mirabilis]
MAGGLLPVACATAVVLSVVRRWLTQHEERTTASVNQLLVQHRLKQDELIERERAVITQERRVQRMTAFSDLRARSVYTRLDMVTDDNQALRKRCEDLETDLAEVSEEYNELVGEVLRQRGSVFTRRTTGTATLIMGGGDEQARPRPVPIPLSRPAADGEDHARPTAARTRCGGRLGLALQRDGTAAREHESM